MNPIIWVVFTLIAQDAIRSVKGVSSLKCLWCTLIRGDK
ncbi:KPN_01571 family protein, partial [Salmonella enterica]